MQITFLSLADKVRFFVAYILTQPSRRRSYQMGVHFWPIYTRIDALRGDIITEFLAEKNMVLCQIGTQYVICDAQHRKKIAAMTPFECKELCRSEHLQMV